MNMPVITTASKTENGEPGIPRDERTPPRDTLIELLVVVEGDGRELRSAGVTRSFIVGHGGESGQLGEE